MPWTPPARSALAQKLIDLGQALGDDGGSLVSLDPDELLASSRRVTGLDDAGDDWFVEPMRRLCSSLDEEAHLHLPGRIRARGELQVILQNRLRLIDLWSRRPEIQGEAVSSPIIVTGLGRSGTTFLHELLSCDPANRPPLLWELLHTVDDGTSPEDRVRLADQEITIMDELVPAFTAMHENRGHLPTECIFLFAHQFSTDMFTGLYNVPSYTIWRSGVDQSPIYAWHKKMLQTLQWQAPTPHWVVKAPSHLSSLPLVFDTYPDARVVMSHRDPLRVVGSLADLMATLHWMHSSHADYDVLVQFLCAGVELQMNEVTKERDEGDLPAHQIADVVYRDLVRDPIGVVANLYREWNMEMSEEFAARIADYVEARHVARDVSHDYRFEDTGLDLSEHRALVAAYQERFGVPSEV